MTGASPSASAATNSGNGVTVDVAGKVRRPGVTTLPAGSRVVDALRKAGGARSGVDLSSLNLARVLVDGEQILVDGGLYRSLEFAGLPRKRAMRTRRLFGDMLEPLEEGLVLDVLDRSKGVRICECGLEDAPTHGDEA